MAKPTQIQLHKHQTVGDFSISFDCKEMDALASRTVLKVQAALKRSPDADPAFLAAILLEQQLCTHEAIRTLNRTHYKGDGLIADAYSLLREQVERVFLIALISRDSGSASSAYWRQAWYRMAFAWAIDEVELQGTGYHPDAQESRRELLDCYRRFEEIPAAALDAVLTDVRGGSIPREVRQVPSPGRIRDSLADSDVGPVLRRLYVEYVRYSGFAHSTVEKVILLAMHHRTRGTFDLSFDAPIRIHLDIVLGENTHMVALACAMALASCNHDPEAVIAVEKCWDTLRPMSLRAETMWQLGIKSLFPPTVNTSAEPHN